MARKRSFFVPLTVDYWSDPQLSAAIETNALCEPMWTRLLGAVKRAEQDGWVHRGSVHALGLPQWRKLMPILISHGLVVEDGDGYRLPAWLKHNMSNEEIAAERERKAANVAAFRLRMANEKAARSPDVTDDVTGNVPSAESTATTEVSKWLDVELVLPGDPVVGTDRCCEQHESESVTGNVTGNGGGYIEQVVSSKQEDTYGVPVSLPGSSFLEDAPASATPTPWEVAHAAISEVFPDASETKAKGFAGEIVKVAKRSGAEPRSLVRLAGVLLRLHGIAQLDALSNMGRSALLGRLAEVLALTPTEKTLQARWACLSTRRGWPGDIGQRLERLISQWHTLDPGTVPLPTAPSAPSAAARQQHVAAAVRDRLQTPAPSPLELPA